jgi:hypothetical protein
MRVLKEVEIEHNGPRDSLIAPIRELQVLVYTWIKNITLR